MEGNDNDDDDGGGVGCCVLIKWLRAGTSSSIMFDEDIRESDMDDTCEIWRFTWASNVNVDCWIFEDDLFVVWDSSSI
jgi:hypothetical protein